MHNKSISALSILLFTIVFNVSGQKLVNSPYARFNIGSLEPAGSFRSIGMGGIASSLRDNNSIYYQNPASYSSLDTNSFSFDFGIDISKSYLSDGESKYNSDDINFDHLIMGFPLTKGWGVAVGLLPYSSGYYKIVNTVRNNDDNYDPMVGEYTSLHFGEGSLSNFFLGSGIKLNKNFSVGINMMVLFGQLKRSYKVNFTDPNVFNNNATERIGINGINFNYGIQYTAALKNNYSLNAGVSMSSNKNYKTDYGNLIFTNSLYNQQLIDTISSVSDESAETYIPGTIRMGLSLGKKDKFTVGFDFISTKWSESKIPSIGGSYAADVKSYLFGIEFIPDKYSNYSFMKRVEYRIGTHFEDNYLIIDGDQLKEIGASFGVGVPLRRSLSKTNFFFDYTRKTGPTDSNLFDENYFTLGISLNLYDYWFIKRKYD
jgi:hypothetical protein